MYNNNIILYYVCINIYIFGPWVFSDTVAVFIVRREVGKQIGSVTQVKRNGGGGGSGKNIHTLFAHPVTAPTASIPTHYRTLITGILINII